MRAEIIDAIYTHKIIAIVRGIYGEDLLKLAEALYAGGIRLMEITFDQADPRGAEKTAEGINRLAARFSGAVLVGAGTVLSPQQVDVARQAGAGYIISPHCDAGVIAHTRKAGLVSIPGAMTPTEIIAAHGAGADFVKVFPAANLGIGYAKSIFAPISHIPCLATGGIGEANLHDYLAAGYAGAGVGGGLADKNQVAAGNFESITRLAEACVAQSRRGKEA